ncbi:MAG: hypothetical protein ACHQQR_14995 [Gemmatimonadales bacterium]
MTNTTKKAMNGATLTVKMAESRYGNPEPRIEVRMPKGTHFRKLHAALHMLAAEIELATPTREGWCVQTDPTSDECGRVYFELSDSTDEEAKRGLALLRQICG